VKDHFLIKIGDIIHVMSTVIQTPLSGFMILSALAKNISRKTFKIW